jgi:hypothetical protein
MPNAEVRNTYKGMADKIRKRESLGWARENLLLKERRGFYCFVMGPVMDCVWLQNLEIFLRC